MITITIVESPNGILAVTDALGGAIYGTSRTCPGLLLSPLSATNTHVYEREVGHISQGPKTWGALRDKEVKHFSLDGNLTVTTRKFQYDTLNGYPRAKRSNGMFVPYRDVVFWGQAFSDVKTLDWGDVSYQGTLYHVGITQYETHFIWDGDYAVLVVVSSREATTIVSSGKVSHPASITTKATLYKRAGSYLRSLKTVSVTGRASDASVLSTLSQYRSLTGSEVGYSDVLSSSYGNADDIAEELFHRVTSHPYPNSLIGNEPIDFGGMGVECAKQLNYVDSNVLLLVLDLAEWRNFRDMWKSIINADGWKHAVSIIKRNGRHMRFKDFLKSLKPGSQSYLWWNYAVLTTRSDVDRISKGVKELISRPTTKRLHSRRIVPLDVPNADSATFTAVLTVEVGLWPNGLLGKIQQLIGETKRWGMYPSMTNLYDLLKYSFVVDWFVQFGDFIEQVQSYLDVKNYFPVNYCIMSSKWEVRYSSSVLVPEYPVTGQIAYRYYVRWISSEVPLPTVALEMGSGPIGHGFEATALILQRV